MRCCRQLVFRSLLLRLDVLHLKHVELVSANQQTSFSGDQSTMFLDFSKFLKYVLLT